MTEKNLIAVVDDDEEVREATKTLMASLGYAAAAFASAENFLRSRWLRRTACLIADMNMPGMTGLGLYHELVRSGRPIPTILITAYPDERARAGALSAGVLGYLSKPYDENELISYVQTVMGG